MDLVFGDALCTLASALLLGSAWLQMLLVQLAQSDAFERALNAVKVLEGVEVKERAAPSLIISSRQLSLCS